MKLQLLIAFLILGTCLQAQTFTTWGTDFWIPNSGGYTVVETKQAANVTVEDLANGSLVSYAYAANSLNTINMNYGTTYNSIDPYFNYNVIDKAIHITSDVAINIRYSFDSHTGGGSSMILPENALGTNYTLSTHHLEALNAYNTSSLTTLILVTATADNTSIDCMLTHPTDNGFPVNTPFTVTLNQGEILQIRGPYCFLDDQNGSPVTGCYSSAGIAVDNDFSGSTIAVQSPSCAPISVHLYTGGYFNYTPIYGSGGCCSDRMMEQYLPENHWGNEFYIVPEQQVNHGNLFKIFSRFDDNAVFINGFPITTLNANETLDTLLFDPSYVKTSKQSFVSQYLLSGASNLTQPIQITDPEIIFVLPIEHQSKEGRFGFPALIFEATDKEQWISIVTENDNVQNVVIDGIPVPASSFTPFSSISPYSWAYLPLSDDDHEVYTSGSFQGMVFGNGQYASRVSYVGIDTVLEPSDSIAYAEIVCYTNESITLYDPEMSDNILWSTGETSDSIVVYEEGLYTVEGFDACGNSQFSQAYLITYSCDPQIAPEFIVQVPCFQHELKVPNVFTPNGDNSNDAFLVELPSCLSDIQFSILNRWGNKVFGTNENSVNWDGFVHGASASEGTYFWLLEAHDELGSTFRASGYITLLY